MFMRIRHKKKENAAFTLKIKKKAAETITDRTKDEINMTEKYLSGALIPALSMLFRYALENFFENSLSRFIANLASLILLFREKQSASAPQSRILLYKEDEAPVQAA